MTRSAFAVVRDELFRRHANAEGDARDYSRTEHVRSRARLRASVLAEVLALMAETERETPDELAQLRAEVEHLPYVREELRYGRIERVDRGQVLALFEDTH